jgi:3-oxoacyl-[acyl-carrier-protein] synthase II
LQHKISINGIGSISALGTSSRTVWDTYKKGQPLFRKRTLQDDIRSVWVSEITSEATSELLKLQQRNTTYNKLDRSVLLAMLATNKAIGSYDFQNKNVAINIGSSRGATGLFEKYHTDYLTNKQVSAYTSPTTTLGNISSWVAQELGVESLHIDHSVTCSTAMHALLNGIAWLQSEMADVFIAGGSESALTPFTLAQMQALKLYSNLAHDFACESMRFQKKKNTMVLGEAAGVAVLERGVSDASMAVIEGFGFASETLAHGSSISKNADCFQRSMKRALDKAELETVDVVILHAPGTVKGDMAEKNAIENVFEARLPLLTSNKWMLGHTFAASGMMSIEMGIHMLQHNSFIENPFYANARHLPKELKTIMINAVGFGGNAVSIILSKP